MTGASGNPSSAGRSAEGAEPSARSAPVDFTDERVNRIADVTFNDEDGEGANAEWWDMLASIDRELGELREVQRQFALYESSRSDEMGLDPESTLVAISDGVNEALGGVS